MTVVIPLPGRLDVNGFARLFSDIVSAKREPIIDDVVIDFSSLKWIEPTGVTVLSNLIQWLKRHGCRVAFQGYDAYTEPIHYLDDSGFFKLYLGHWLQDNAHVRTTTKPLEFIGTAQSLAWLQSNLLMWITNNSGKDAAAFRELRVCLLEIFHNIRDHSGMDIGSVFAQYYPNKKGLLSVSISDIGIGIPGKIKLFDPSYKNFTDSEAIIKASEYGFTTSSHAGNAGRGLANLVDIVTKHYAGSVIIISDYGYVRWTSGACVSKDRTWLYPGSLIDISIEVENLAATEEQEEDFQW